MRNANAMKKHISDSLVWSVKDTSWTFLGFFAVFPANTSSFILLFTHWYIQRARAHSSSRQVCQKKNLNRLHKVKLSVRQKFPFLLTFSNAIFICLCLTPEQRGTAHLTFINCQMHWHLQKSRGTFRWGEKGFRCNFLSRVKREVLKHLRAFTAGQLTKYRFTFLLHPLE